MPLKVIFTDDSKVFSGAESSLAQFLEAVDTSLIAPRICFRYPMEHQNRFGPLLRNAVYRSKEQRWWMGSDRWKLPVRGSDFCARIINAYRLVRIARRDGTGVIHFNLTWPNTLNDLVFAKLAGFVTVAHIRGLSDVYRLPPRVMRLCDVLICVSDAVKERAVSWYSHPNIHRVYNPIDASRYIPKGTREEALRALGLSESRRVIASVGLLSPQKGHDVAIRAFARIADKFKDVDLLVAGGSADGSKGGVEAIRLESEVALLGLQERVIITDKQIEDVTSVYAASQLILSLTTCGEAFGRVPVEAGSAGRATIVTDLGASQELITQGVTGFLASPSNLDQIARLMDRLLSSSEECDRIGAAAREHVINNFSATANATGIMEVYRRSGLLDRHIH